MSETTPSYVSHDSFICVTPPVDKCDTPVGIGDTTPVCRNTPVGIGDMALSAMPRQKASKRQKASTRRKASTRCNLCHTLGPFFFQSRPMPQLIHTLFVTHNLCMCISKCVRDTTLVHVSDMTLAAGDLCVTEYADSIFLLQSFPVYVYHDAFMSWT